MTMRKINSQTDFEQEFGYALQKKYPVTHNPKQTCTSFFTT